MQIVAWGSATLEDVPGSLRPQLEDGASPILFEAVSEYFKELERLQEKSLRTLDGIEEMLVDDLVSETMESLEGKPGGTIHITYEGAEDRVALQVNLLLALINKGFPSFAHRMADGKTVRIIALAE